MICVCVCVQISDRVNWETVSQLGRWRILDVVRHECDSLPPPPLSALAHISLVGFVFWHNSPCKAHDADAVLRTELETEIVLALFNQSDHAHVVGAYEQLVHVVLVDVCPAQVGILYNRVHYGRTDAGYVHDATLLIAGARTAIEACELGSARD